MQLQHVCRGPRHKTQTRNLFTWASNVRISVMFESQRVKPDVTGCSLNVNESPYLCIHIYTTTPASKQKQTLLFCLAFCWIHYAQKVVLNDVRAHINHIPFRTHAKTDPCVKRIPITIGPYTMRAYHQAVNEAIHHEASTWRQLAPAAKSRTTTIDAVWPWT